MIGLFISVCHDMMIQNRMVQSDLHVEMDFLVCSLWNGWIPLTSYRNMLFYSLLYTCSASYSDIIRRLFCLLTRIGDDSMILLEAKQLQLTIHDRSLFNIDRLLVQSGDRIGLVGKNGSGKTTLLELLAKQRAGDAGEVIHHASCQLLPQLKKTSSTKSGGEVTQEYINHILKDKHDLLLADEPTTHLDTNHIEKLEDHLKRWPGAFILVSHDRKFLDSLCTTIWELEDGNIHIFQGNYSHYVEQKELERRKQEKAYEQYVKKKEQLEEALVLKEQKARKATKKPKKTSASEARILGSKPYFAKKQKKLNNTAKAIETRLEKLDKVEKIKETPPLRMKLPNEEAMTGRSIIKLHDVSGKIGERLLWKKASFEIKGGEKIAIIGNNGVGKTSLIKKVINHEAGIQIAPSVKIGYFSQNLDILDYEKTILENVLTDSYQEESMVRIILARLHFFRDDVFKKVNILSGGERVKVAFAKLFVSDINLLILDEPTNFLDIEAVEALESLLQEYKGTLVIVSHDRQFVQSICTKLIEIANQQMNVFDGSYEQYKKYTPQVSRDVKAEKLLLLETKIADVLSRISIEPSDELEEEFQQLIKEKRSLQD